MLDMLLTQDNYEKKKWLCMGVAINEHYASVWFGQRKDKLPVPDLCDTIGTDNDTVFVSHEPAKSTVFYLIFGSFENMKDAKEALKRYKKAGFEAAGILNKNNRIRLYLIQFGSLKEAVFAKKNLPYTYQEAWILKD